MAVFHLKGNVQRRRGGQLIREHIVDLRARERGGGGGSGLETVTWNCKPGITPKDTVPVNSGDIAAR